ncbi:tetratricopeptide repeat protein, partial [candidate division KSB1 bacterium]
QIWKDETKERYKYLPELIRTVVELDPYFFTPYIIGGLLISMKAGRPNESIDILKNGQLYFPDAWQINYLLGYNYFFYLNDSTNAVNNFMLAAKYPECPRPVRNIAVGILLNSGRRSVAIEFINSIKEQAQDEKFREEMEKILEELAKTPADSTSISKGSALF